MNTMDTEVEEEILWANGWVFFKGGEDVQKFLPQLDNCLEWMKGFLAAMTEYNIEPYQEYQSVQEALHSQGISGDVLEACLISTESIANSDEWCRFPDVPIRS
ncbi:MAG: hypothetical protein K9L22_03865 [Methylococcaceae bacterium]|nr:hypothetical protein [Methylococcaceae bacterium]